ncbi:MAG: phosphate acyltransferase PlsX [Chloroflexi bacterium GWC2_73_18]|nr:MAG: phosphate acyltransferase PlsX [Chloroflexi bacterium GWC2_73_18]
MDLSAVRPEAVAGGDASRRIRVAVDAMGGDYGAEEVVAGALEYAREDPSSELILVGDEARIARCISGPLPDHVSLVAASQVIEMDDQPALALREKRDSSITVATDLVREGRADAVVSAGHTGAAMAAGVLRLGRLPGVDRPALAVQLLTEREQPLVLLDIGANPDSTGQNLYQYAHMGAVFAEQVMGVVRPRVALLSIGEEKGKGDARIVDATARLDHSTLDFIGNVEGKDLTRGLADVVVCDAVIGNVVIKFFEGLSGFIVDQFRAEFRRPPFGPLAAFLLRPGIARIRRRLDWERLGGAPLLGVGGTVIITHGRARRRMIRYAVGVGAAAARARIPERIARALAPGQTGARLSGEPSAAEAGRPAEARA